MTQLVFTTLKGDFIRTQSLLLCSRKEPPFPCPTFLLGASGGREPGLVVFDFWTFHRLPHSVWADGSLADQAVQDGKRMEHPNQSPPNPARSVTTGRTFVGVVKIASPFCRLPRSPHSADAGVAKRLVQLPLGLVLLGISVVLDLLDGRLHLRVVLQSAARVQKELVDAPERLVGHNFILIYEPYYSRNRL